MRYMPMGFLVYACAYSSIGVAIYFESFFFPGYCQYTAFDFRGQPRSWPCLRLHRRYRHASPLYFHNVGHHRQRRLVAIKAAGLATAARQVETIPHFALMRTYFPSPTIRCRL